MNFLSLFCLVSTESWRVWRLITTKALYSHVESIPKCSDYWAERPGGFCTSDTIITFSGECRSSLEGIRGFHHARRTRTLQKQPIREQGL